MPTPIRFDSGVRFDQPGITWDGLLPDPAPPSQTPPLPPNLNPLNMQLNTSIDFLKHRVDKTRSVQAQIAGEWTWSLHTLAEWQADSLALDKSEPSSLANIADEAHTLAKSSRGDLDSRLATTHTQTVAVVGVMRSRVSRQPDSRHVVDELSARAESRDGIEKEGTACLSAWKLEFGGAAFVPGPGLTYATFRDLFHGHAANPGATPPVLAMASLRDLKETNSDNATIDRR